MNRAILIAGPTASGKTTLSYRLAEELGGEIINGDSAQIYEPFMVGTAKPNWIGHPIPHHLFDRLNAPGNYDVAQYRSEVLSLVSEMSERDAVPLIVGGSLFYFKSLFFPVDTSVVITDDATKQLDTVPINDRWRLLQSIDPERAEAINPQDMYRLNRALAIYFSSNTKPSELKPELSVPFPATIIFLNPDRGLLYERINQRTLEMVLDEGWVEECERIMNLPEWEVFARQKKFVGYSQLFDWIRDGKSPQTLSRVIRSIQKETRHYAKRQVTFWKSLLSQIDVSQNELISIKQYTTHPYPEDEIVDAIKNDIAK